MSAVKGPFVFVSDDYVANAPYESADQTTNRLISRSKLAGCKSIALFARQTPTDQAARFKAEGFQIIAWDVTHDGPEAVEADLRRVGAEIWMPQMETVREMTSTLRCLEAGLHTRFPCEPVMTSGGMDAGDGRTVEDNKRLMRQFGVNTVWVEVYLQDQNPEHPNLGNVNHMIWHFEYNYGFPEAHPVVGLWNGVSVKNYDLSQHGRMFSAWRSQQMDEWQYGELASIPDLPPPAPPSATDIRNQVVSIAKEWDDQNPGARLSRIHIARRIASTGSTDTRWNAAREDIVTRLDSASFPFASSSTPAGTGARLEIGKVVKPWVDANASARLARLSVIMRIVGSGSIDTRWNLVREQIADTLDNAGIPA